MPIGTVQPTSPTADDIYITIAAPPGYISGVPTDVFGIVGTASWGPVNMPEHMGSPYDALQNWGAISAAALTDPYDLATDLAIAFGQATSGATLEGWAVRVTDGTDTAATGSITGAATSASETVTVGGSILAGDVASITITSSAISGSPVTVKTTVVGGDTTSTVAARLAAAINANAGLVAAGIQATSSSNAVSIYQPATLSPQATYSKSIVGTASATATIGGTITADDTVALIFTNAAETGSARTKTYTVGGGDTIATIAAGLVALINGDADLPGWGIVASNVGPVITVRQTDPYANSTVITDSVGGVATETVTLSNSGDLTGGPDLTLTLGSGAPVTGSINLAALYTGVVGNGITSKVVAGSAANTYSVTMALPAIGITELYQNIPSNNFWSALAAAISTGQSGGRGPSGIVKATGFSGVGAPTVGTGTFSGGTDGRAGVTTSTLLGSNTAVPATGIYALAGVNPSVGVDWIVGCTDYVDAASSVLAFGQTNACSSLFPFAAGTSTATALSNAQAAGIHDPSFAWVKDWIYWFDAVNNVQRLVPPTAFLGGMICTLPPSNSPGNKQVKLVNGTERNNPITGNQPYSESEIGQLESAGIMLITNPIPAGATFGSRHGLTTSLNAVTAPFEYWRMSTFLAKSFEATLGGYVDELQSAQPNDPLRNSLKTELNTFLQSLMGANGSVGLIDSYSVVCSYSANGTPGNGVNSDASIAAHFLYCLVRVKYLSSVRFFFLTIQGGTTVVTIGSGPGQQGQS